MLTGCCLGLINTVGRFWVRLGLFGQALIFLIAFGHGIFGVENFLRETDRLLAMLSQEGYTNEQILLFTDHLADAILYSQLQLMIYGVIVNGQKRDASEIAEGVWQGLLTHGVDEEVVFFLNGKLFRMISGMLRWDGSGHSLGEVMMRKSRVVQQLRLKGLEDKDILEVVDYARRTDRVYVVFRRIG